MKKLSAIILTLALVFSLAACGNGDNIPGSNATVPPIMTPAPAVAPVPTVPPLGGSAAVKSEAPSYEAAYPENFFSLSGKSIGYNTSAEPKELYSWEGANGPVRILDYGTEIVYELEYAGGKHHLDTGYVNESFITSEGISAGSAREEVLAAYKKYGITNIVDGYPGGGSELDAVLKNGLADSEDGDGFNGYRWLWLIKALCEKETNIDTENLLYVDNGTPEGIEQFGGLGALIFVFDNSGAVKMIIGAAPTSG